MPIYNAATSMINAFQRGLAERRSEEDRVTEAEDRKLQQDLLKHRLAQMKMEDRVREWEMKTKASSDQVARIGTQRLSDLSPSQLNPAEFGLAPAASGLPPASPSPKVPPSSNTKEPSLVNNIADMLANQFSSPPTQEVMTQPSRPKPVMFPGVPGTGQADYPVVPKTIEDITAQSLADLTAHERVKEMFRDPKSYPEGTYVEDPQSPTGFKQVGKKSVRLEKVPALLPNGTTGFLNHNPDTGEFTNELGQSVVGARPIPPQGPAQSSSEQEIEEAARQFVSDPKSLTSLRMMTGMMGGQRFKLYSAIKKIDPTFDPGLIDRRITFLGQYEDPKGRARINRDAMNNILMHSADLSTVNKGYRRTNLKIANTAVNTLASQYSEAYTAYMVPLTVLQNEIELYFAGGYAPHEQQKKDWAKIVNGGATPNQIERFAKEIIHVGLRRADTHNQAFTKNMGYDDPNLITPDAVSAAQQLGMGKEVAKFGSGGSYGSSTQRPSPNAGGWTLGTQPRSITGPDGKTVTFPSDATFEAAKKDVGLLGTVTGTQRIGRFEIVEKR